MPFESNGGKLIHSFWYSLWPLDTREKRLVNDKHLAQTVSFETDESPHTDTDIMCEGHEGES